jgi:hypothetical protein
LKNIKHEKNEKGGGLLWSLLKLANSLQHMTTYSFLTTTPLYYYKEKTLAMVLYYA